MVKRLHTDHYTREETQRVAAYLTTKCDTRQHYWAEPPVMQLPPIELNADESMYPRLIEEFLRVLNSTPKEDQQAEVRRKARHTIWRLFEAQALPRCQMVRMCIYVRHCAALPRMKASADSYIYARDESAKATRSILGQIDELKLRLGRNAAMAKALFGHPELCSDMRQILQMLSTCLSRVRDNTDFRTDLVRVSGPIREVVASAERYRAAMLNPPHPQGRRATAAEAELFLSFLYEAINGVAPPDYVTVHFASNNTLKNKSRYASPAAVAKVASVLDGSHCESLTTKELIWLVRTLLQITSLSGPQI